jgi:hypothetical protein
LIQAHEDCSLLQSLHDLLIPLTHTPLNSISFLVVRGSPLSYGIIAKLSGVSRLRGRCPGTMYLAADDDPVLTPGGRGKLVLRYHGCRRLRTWIQPESACELMM